MADNTRDSISLTSVAHGLENMGAEFLEKMVCPLPLEQAPPHLGWHLTGVGGLSLTGSSWAGGLCVHFSLSSQLCLHSTSPVQNVPLYFIP